MQFISDGDQSSYVRSILVDLEAQARSEKEAIEAIRREATEPIHLPSPREIECSSPTWTPSWRRIPSGPGSSFGGRFLAERDHRRSGDWSRSGDG